MISKMTEGASLSLEIRERLGGEENRKTVLAVKSFRLLTAMYLVKEEDDFLNQRLVELENTVKAVAPRILGRSISRSDREFSAEIRERYGGMGSRIGTLAESLYLIFSVICKPCKSKSELHTMFIGTEMVVKSIMNELYDYSVFKGEEGEKNGLDYLRLV